MDKMQRQFLMHTPNTIVGAGTAENVGEVVEGLSGTRALVVTDAGVVNAGLLDAIKGSLEAHGIAFGLFEECLPDAPLSIVNKCARVVKDGNYDIVIGVGGGSVIDTAKVASLSLPDDFDIRTLIGFEQVKKQGIPKIFIPTTAGTGSEVTQAAVITDTSGGQKKPIYSRFLRADAAIIDPMMTLNLPAKITADTGFDALSHAIEAYTTWKANIVSDMYAETAIKLVAENLPIAYAKGRKNLEARHNMAVAATLGILAAESSGAGVAHSMNYPIAMKARISHGSALSIILPHVMEYNLIGNPLKYGKIARLMGAKIENLSPLDAAHKAEDAARGLVIQLGMPQRLRDVGIKKEDIPEFVNYLFEFQLYGMENNARDLGREDATKIFEAAY